MSKLTVQTLVSAPLDTVFAVYTDLPKATERIPTITALFVKEGDGTHVTWTFGGTPLTFGAKIMAPVMGLFFNGVYAQVHAR